MASRIYSVQAGERRFCVRVTADKGGYYARVLEEIPGQPGERTAPAGLHVPPRLEIDAAAFFQNRKRYRRELIELVNAELCAWRVKKLDREEAEQDNDGYIRASLIGWPEGYPHTVEDSLEDWDGAWPSLGVTCATKS